MWAALKMAGPFLLKYWQAFALVGVLGLSWFQGWRIDSLKDRVSGYKRSIQAHETAAGINIAQLEHCAQINAANEREANRQREKADEAAIRAKMLAAELDQRVIVMPREAEEFNDEECRTLDQPLPADFVEWLRGT